MSGGVHADRVVTMLYVDDVARSRDFYRDVVGLAPLLDAGGYVEFSWGNLVLGLRSRENARRQFPDAVRAVGAGSSHQLVAEVENLDEVWDRLTAAQVDIAQGLTTQEWGMRSFAFRDPDGQLWEICQPVDDSESLEGG